jgi:phosphatidylserine/phosphatidylglycerophosphate/cardiolipin synthase-like enzyme
MSMKRYTALLLLSVLSTLSLAQEVVTRPISKSEEIAEVINASTQELLLVTDTFRNETLADAVRVAALERGVKVFVLAPEELAQDLSSYFGTLSQAGATVHLQEATGAFLVIDRKYVIQGNLLSELENPQTTTPTMLIASQDYANHLTQLFIEAFEGATTWVYEPQ